MTQPAELETLTEGGPARARAVSRRIWIAIAITLVGIALGYSQYRSTQPLIIVGDGAGTYSALVYERHTFYWVSPDGRRGVDTTFRVVYYSHERDPERMRAEARRIAPALWPYADSAGLTRFELEPSRPLLMESFPLAVMSYDVRYRRLGGAPWKEVSGW